ncbi:MAG: PD-(D/E)XK nuclease family protein [Bacteroidota bacterium]
MTIYFGLELNDPIYLSNSQQVEGGIHYLGPQSLLYLLESHLGLIGWPNNNEHLRIEQFRQAMSLWLESHPNSFFAGSFAADQFATATALLALRDELILAGWNFEVEDQMPERLRSLAGLASIFKTAPNKDLFNPQGLQLAIGIADRFQKVLTTLPKRKVPVKKLCHIEPFHLLPNHLQHLLQLLQESGTIIEQSGVTPAKGKSDLANLQRFLSKKEGSSSPFPLHKDGSVLIVKTQRETEGAAWLAQLFKDNPSYRPLCIIPEKNRALDNALIQEGLPSLGIQSASPARPSLQILKLITTFLWHPIDPYKIMEFVSLSVKPLADDLAVEIARQMANTPGLNGEGWYIMKQRYFNDLAERVSQKEFYKIQNQFNLWFERKRYNAQQKVPKSEAIELFAELNSWARELEEGNKTNSSSFSVLIGQAQRIVDLLEALPPSLNLLSMLELERIVRTIYEPSPVVFKEREVGHLPYVHHSSTCIKPVDEVLWWNFTQNERDYFFSHWYQSEIKYFAKKEIQLEGPQIQNARLLWQRPIGIQQCQKRLLLMIPEKVNGQTVFPHPLKDELEACFGDLEAITFTIDNQAHNAHFDAVFSMPQSQQLNNRQLGKPKAFLQIKSAKQLGQNEQETFSSLNTLFYYPYQWVFRHKLGLRQSSILSIVPDITLMGNLSHRFFELLLQESVEHWEKEKVYQWVDDQANKLLSKEGAVLLMYGREPEKIAFLNRIKYAAWSLLSLIQDNGWQIKGIEQSMKDQFFGLPIKGKADLVLSRGEELAVVDLKWRGAVRREKMIKNEEDLQLVMYSKLLTQDNTWAHTAYFILENGKLIARNQLAFKEAVAIQADQDHLEINERIWQRMEKTYLWRLEQVQNGQIEIRTKHTLPELEDEYGEMLLELLEMKDQDAPFDDYRTLINLVT